MNLTLNKSSSMEPTETDFHTLLARIVSAVYGVISLGFFSNVVVAIVVGNILLRLGSSLPNRHMLVYVFALCIVDALVLGTLPMLIVQIYLQKWIFGQTLCTIYWTIDSINKTLSTFILTCLSFDRYLAVRFPHRCMRLRTVRGSLYILFCCVVFAALLLMPVYLHAEVTLVEIEPNDNASQSETEKVAVCAFVGKSSFIFTVFILCYSVPFACMSFFYGSMLVRLRHRSRKLGVRQGRVRRVTTKTLTLVISYFLFWSPYWIMTLRHVIADAFRSQNNATDTNDYVSKSNSTLLTPVNSDDEETGDDFGVNAALFVLMYVTHSGCYLNSAINPILYALLNLELRRQHYAAMSVASRAGGSLVLFNNSVHANGNGRASHCGVSAVPSSPFLAVRQQQQPLIGCDSPNETAIDDCSIAQAKTSCGATYLKQGNSFITRRPKIEKKNGKFWNWSFRAWNRGSSVQCELNDQRTIKKSKSYTGASNKVVSKSHSGSLDRSISAGSSSSDSDKNAPVSL